ncbi:MAG: PEGA domain-containing protein, partial [Deltaproteobacteria bacterium]|nr:PEGA domain-containing protein [Deltaproteobacteria bacterium]
TIPSSPKAIASTPPPAMPVPQGTLASSPKAIASTPPPAAPVSPAAPQETPHQSPKIELALTSARLPATSAENEGVVFPSEPNSDEVVLPMERPRVVLAAAALGALLLIGSALTFGLRAYSKEGDAELDAAQASRLATPPRTVTASEAAAQVPSAAVANPDTHARTAKRALDPDGDEGASAPAPDASSAMVEEPDSQALVEVAADPAAEAPAPVAGDAEGSRMASGTASVTIRTDPWGSVWVDGRYIGRSPAIVVLPVGPHQLGGGVGHIMGTRDVRISARAHQHYVVHVDYPGH